MDNEWSALNTFWNKFGIPAYDVNTVPDGVTFPYITYEAAVSDMDNKLLLTASIWYQSTSWTEICEKAHEISCFIGGGAGIPYMGGRLWITKESPFARRMGEPSDDMVRRMLLQIGAEFQ